MVIGYMLIVQRVIRGLGGAHQQILGPEWEGTVYFCDVLARCRRCSI
ncbi:MAG: hypothetical protein UY16_C0030G0003 [Candidatus Gottesmanbacteria bacterium GW2011_GWA2_47_9]|uniref:Uncharacterized protein n=1 Tax=Candidatus Gottesmanbacteria bacterium GW2011_GWA2_47_9 TaxID=1618445 RepID=A0A0G1WAH1_9BACT|nr:MAG: hypothetical protein UY16_C0030G0003 [Candidatus Gottesmanbacteria bacterium GW2011_GWA2_47_9]